MRFVDVDVRVRLVASTFALRASHSRDGGNLHLACQPKLAPAAAQASEGWSGSDRSRSLGTEPVEQRRTTDALISVHDDGDVRGVIYRVVHRQFERENGYLPSVCHGSVFAAIAAACAVCFSFRAMFRVCHDLLSVFGFGFSFLCDSRV